MRLPTPKGRCSPGRWRAGPPPAAAVSRLRGVARRSPIALFLAIVFGLGYPLMFLPLLADRGVIPGGSLPGMVGLDVERAASLLMVLLALFPAALIVSALEGGRPAVIALLRRAVIWRIGAVWWVVVFLALPVTTILLALLLGDSFRAPSLGTLGAELAGLAAGFFLVNLWEEIAWAGFLQTRLERRHGLYRAAALTALPFAGIHMPLQVINGVTAPADLAVAFAALAVLGLVFRSMEGLMLRGAGNSLLAVALMHTVFNRSNNTDGIAAKLLVGGHRQVAALIATAAVTVVLAIVLRAKATREERARLDAANGEGQPARA